MIRMIVRKYANLYEVILSTKKSLLKASNIIRTPLKEQLGCSREGFKGRRVRGHLPPPRASPLNGVVMFMTKIQLKIIINLGLKKRSSNVND